MTKPACASCTHYVSTRSEAAPEEQGVCRRFPPAAALNPAGQWASSFAPVRGSFACGEFSAKLIELEQARGKGKKAA